jgi:hypothetical protein
LAVAGNAGRGIRALACRERPAFADRPRGREHQAHSPAPGRAFTAGPSHTDTARYSRIRDVWSTEWVRPILSHPRTAQRSPQ